MSNQFLDEKHFIALFFSEVIQKLSVRGSSESEIISFRFGISPASHTIRDLAALD